MESPPCTNILKASGSLFLHQRYDTITPRAMMAIVEGIENGVKENNNTMQMKMIEFFFMVNPLELAENGCAPKYN